MGKYLTIIFLFLCLTCMGQDVSKSKLIQKNDTLFLESNGEKYVVDKKHLVVKLKPSIKELDADIKQIDITKSGYRLIEVPNGMDVINYAQKLEKTNCYESVDYNTFCRVYFTLNDQYASSQDYLPLIDASRAWDITTGNPNIKVAIIDTGIKRDHEDLGYGSDSYTNVSYSLGYDYIENTSYHDPDDSHGTEVGGVAGAKTNNGIGSSHWDRYLGQMPRTPSTVPMTNPHDQSYLICYMHEKKELYYIGLLYHTDVCDHELS